MQPFVQIIIWLVILGLIWWLIDNHLPLPDPIRVVIKVACVLGLIIWLAGLAGYPVLIR